MPFPVKVSLFVMIKQIRKEFTMSKYWKEKERKKWGKRYFDFDEELEKNIYFFICKENIGNKYLKKLEKKKVLYDTYSQWNDYVTCKYKAYSLKSLKEFAAYLKQRARKMHVYSIFAEQNMAPFIIGFVTAVMAEPFGTLIAQYANMLKADLISGLVAYAFLLVFILIISGLVVPIINSIIDNITNRATKKAFFEDYINVIEELIVEKKNSIKEAQ